MVVHDQNWKIISVNLYTHKYNYTVEPLRKGQPLYKGHFQYPQSVLYMQYIYNFQKEYSLPSLYKGQKGCMVPKCLAFPQRFHCIVLLLQGL